MNRAASIKGKLENLARKENKLFASLLTYYLIERFLYRLSISDYARKFVLKGGVLLYALLENNARTTRDIDLLVKGIDNSQAEIARIFAILCDMDCDDGIRYDKSSIKVETIKEGADYEGVRIKFLGYLDKAHITMQFDLGFGDVVVPEPTVMNYPVLLDMEHPQILTYSLESVIAEKFEAIIYLAETNSRMKDFYDIYIICRTYDFNGIVLTDAISQAFRHRGTHLNDRPSVFSDDFPHLPNKQTQWKAFQNRVQPQLLLDFAEVNKMIGTFLLPIYECILKQEQFTGKWNHSESGWKFEN
jgi:predicted nucleotidyltransferase component of viral defense system